MLGVESLDKALQVTGTLVRSKEGTEVVVDRFIRHVFWVLIRRTQRTWRTVHRLVREHRFERAAQTSGFHHRNKGLEGLGRPVVVRVAVRERESSNAFRVESREYLGDTAATIVSDKVHLIDVQRIEKLAKHLGIRGDRYVLVRRDFRVAVRKQVERDRAAKIRKSRLLVTPKKSVQQYAVHEQCNRTRSLVGIADTPRSCRYTTFRR